MARQRDTRQYGSQITPRLRTAALLHPRGCSGESKAEATQAEVIDTALGLAALLRHLVGQTGFDTARSEARSRASERTAQPRYRLAFGRRMRPGASVLQLKQARLRLLMQLRQALA
jgi:hypothetical protein